MQLLGNTRNRHKTVIQQTPRSVEISSSCSQLLSCFLLHVADVTTQVDTAVERLGCAEAIGGNRSRLMPLTERVLCEIDVGAQGVLSTEIGTVGRAVSRGAREGPIGQSHLVGEITLNVAHSASGWVWIENALSRRSGWLARCGWESWVGSIARRVAVCDCVVIVAVVVSCVLGV